MKVLILGATGPTGGHVLTNALEGGDTVTVLARREMGEDSIEEDEGEHCDEEAGQTAGIMFHDKLL